MEKEYNNLIAGFDFKEIENDADLLLKWIDENKYTPANGFDIYFEFVRKMPYPSYLYSVESGFVGLIFRIINNCDNKDAIQNNFKANYLKFLEETKDYELLAQLVEIVNKGLEHRFLKGIVKEGLLKELNQKTFESCYALWNTEGTNDNEGLYEVFSIFWDLDNNIEIKEKLALIFLQYRGSKNLVLSYSLPSFFDEQFKKSQPTESFSIPPLNELYSKGEEMLKTNCAEGFLCLSLSKLMAALSFTRDYISDLKKGTYGNPSNTPGFSVVEGALQCLKSFSNYYGIIADYFINQKLDNEKIYIIVKAFQNMHSYKPHENKFITTIVKAVYENSAEAEKYLIEYAVILRLVDPDSIKGYKRPKVPGKFPHNVDDLKKFMRTLKIKSYQMRFKAKTKLVPDEWPEDLKGIYLWNNGSGQRQFISKNEMNELRDEIEMTIKEHFSDIEGEDCSYSDGEFDVRESWSENAIPVGTDWGGDMFFVSDKMKSQAGTNPVVRFRHDVAMTACIEAESLAELIARRMIEIYIEENGDDSRLQKLLKQKPKAEFIKM